MFRIKEPREKITYWGDLPKEFSSLGQDGLKLWNQLRDIEVKAYENKRLKQLKRERGRRNRKKYILIMRISKYYHKLLKTMSEKHKTSVSQLVRHSIKKTLGEEYKKQLILTERSEQKEPLIAYGGLKMR